MGVFSQLISTAFNEVDVPAPSEVVPSAPPTNNGNELDLDNLFGNITALHPDLTKLDPKSMKELRLQAFEGENEESSMKWAGNLTELKKRCLTDNTCEACQTLATESLHMAYKYYQLWDSAMSFKFDEAFGVDKDFDVNDVDTAATGAAVDGVANDLADATAQATADADTGSAMDVVEAGMGSLAALVGAIGATSFMSDEKTVKKNFL